MEFYYNYFQRILLIIINIMIVLLMSFALINYALFSLHLGDVTAEEKQALIDGGTPASDIYPYDFHSTKVVVFHALAAVAFGLIMILIGLVNTFSSKKVVAVIEEEQTAGEITIEDLEQQKKQESSSEHELTKKGGD